MISSEAAVRAIVWVQLICYTKSIRQCVLADAIRYSSSFYVLYVITMLCFGIIVLIARAIMVKITCVVAARGLVFVIPWLVR